MVSVFNLTDADMFLATMFFVLIIGIVIGGAVMAHFTKKIG
jgi:hypothetical protein